MKVALQFTHAEAHSAIHEVPPATGPVERRRQDALRRAFEAYRHADARDAMVMRIHAAERRFRGTKPARRVRLDVAARRMRPC